MLEFAFLLMVTATLAALLVGYRRGRGGRVPEQPEFGTLDVTGVSPRPDAPGEQFVTITGRLSGPTVAAHVVYGRLVWDSTTWPAVGDRYDAVYPSGKPERWQLAR